MIAKGGGGSDAVIFWLALTTIDWRKLTGVASRGTGAHRAGKISRETSHVTVSRHAPTTLDFVLEFIIGIYSTYITLDYDLLSKLYILV